MTTENYLILTICLLAIFPICFGIALLIHFISECIKEHRNDYRIDTAVYDVKTAKHLFCYLYEHAAEFDVYEVADSDDYLIQKKEFTVKDFDEPFDDEDDDIPICFDDVNGNMSDIE